jgi:hypothetical protein
LFEYGSLFCGHDSGTFIVERHLKIYSKSGTWKFKTVPNQKGFASKLLRDFGIGKVNNQWRYRNKISGLIIQHDISKLRMRSMLVMNIKAF